MINKYALFRVLIWMMTPRGERNKNKGKQQKSLWKSDTRLKTSVDNFLVWDVSLGLSFSPHDALKSIVAFFLFFTLEFAVLEFDFCCAWFKVAKFKKKGGKEKECKLFYLLFFYLPVNKEVCFVRYSDRMMRKPRVRNWNDAFPAKKRKNGIN